VVNYQGITNVFGVFVDGSLAMGMTTNVVYVPNQLEVASNLNVDGSLSIGGSSFDSNGNLGMQGNLSFFGSDQSINFDGTGSSIAGNNVGAAGIQINTAGNGVAIDGNFAATGSEKLTILRGSVNPDGSVSGGTNFSVTYIPPGTGGVNFLFPVTCQNGANSFTVANDASSSFPTGLWMKLGAGFYQVTGVNINPLEGGGVTSTIQFLPVFSGSSGSYQPVRNMTLYPTYTVSFTNVFSVPPTVLISGSGAWPTQQVVYPNFLITAWSAFLDYSQPITSTNFGVMVDDVGAYPGPGPGIGFSFVAIGPR